MNAFQQWIRLGRCVLVLWGIGLSAVPCDADEGTLLNFIGEPSQGLLDGISQEFQCEWLGDWYYNRQNTLVIECHRGEITLEAHLYGSTAYDLNDDGRNDIVLGIYFPFREHTSWKDDDRDLLLLYTVNDGHTVQQVFRKELDPGEQGRIKQLWLEDVTGDGVPEILCVHSNLYIGAKRDNYERRLLILRGRPPFLLLGEKTIEGETIRKEGFFLQQADMQWQDIDHDGILELLLAWSEAPDDGSPLVPLASAPEIYHVTFALTAAVLDALRQAGLPEAALQALQDQTFLSKAAFLQAVAQQIGADAAAQYGELIVQTAIGPYRAQQP